MPYGRDQAAPVLAVENLRKTYTQKGGWLRAALVVPALRGVTLEISAGSSVAICGESGSGKSTLAKCIAGIEDWDTGSVRYEGRDVGPLPMRERLAALRDVQLVFQDAASSLNPIFTAEEAIAEPLIIAGRGTKDEQRRAARELMLTVGLDPECATRRPLEFSGGQRQRIAVARALAAQAKVIIFDEAFTGLDLLTREAIMLMLKRLRSERGLTYIHISHDVEWVEKWVEEIIEMKSGRVTSHRATGEEFLSHTSEELGREGLAEVSR